MVSHLNLNSLLLYPRLQLYWDRPLLPTVLNPFNCFVAMGPGANEIAHLHKLDDFAVALCRTPAHTILIFSLPQCKLLHQIKLSDLGSIERPLEEDDLDQRFLMRNNTMMFIFHHPQFFFDDDDNVIMHANQIQPSSARRFGRLLFVDFTQFLSSQKTPKNPSTVNSTSKKLTKHALCNNINSNSNNPLVSMRIDPHFDCNDDYIEKISVISKDRMVCVMSSGKIMVREVRTNSHNASICSHVDRLSIACPLDLKLPDEGGNSSNMDDTIDDEGRYLSNKAII